MYEWIKALHVIAVHRVDGGMLYLPRPVSSITATAEAGSKQSETFKVMEWRLLKAIINPAMIVDLAGRTLPRWAGHWFSASWLHASFCWCWSWFGRSRFFFPLRQGFRRRSQSA